MRSAEFTKNPEGVPAGNPRDESRYLASRHVFAHEPILSETRKNALIKEIIGAGVSQEEAKDLVQVTVAGWYDFHSAAHTAKSSTHETFEATKVRRDGIKGILDFMSNFASMNPSVIQKHKSSIQQDIKALRGDLSRFGRMIVKTDSFLLPEDQGHQKK